MVAKRKTPKDEVPLPPAARDNPYAMCSREELDAALHDIDVTLASLPKESPERIELREKRTQVVQAYAWRMVRIGLASWNGGKPKDRVPVIATPGPRVASYVHEQRR
jgi:hypothetical protein